MTSKLKELIIKRAVGQHKDLNGGVVDIFDKKYYVDAFKGEVKEVKEVGS